MENWVSQLGPLGTLIVFALYIIYKEMKDSKGPEGDTLKRIDRKILGMETQMHDLHDWHDKEDNDGIKVWYVRSSLEESINKLAINVEKQTEIYRELILSVKDLNLKVELVYREVEALKSKVGK